MYLRHLLHVINFKRQDIVIIGHCTSRSREAKVLLSSINVLVQSHIKAIEPFLGFFVEDDDLDFIDEITDDNLDCPFVAESRLDAATQLRVISSIVVMVPCNRTIVPIS